MHGSAPWKTEEAIVSLPRLLVLSAFSRSDSPDLVHLSQIWWLLPFTTPTNPCLRWGHGLTPCAVWAHPSPPFADMVRQHPPRTDSIEQDAHPARQSTPLSRACIRPIQA